MTSILLDTASALALLGIVAIVWLAGRTHFTSVNSGWQFILGGYGLLLTASMLGLFATMGAADWLVPAGDDLLLGTGQSAAFVSGLALLLIGLLRRAPAVQAMLVKSNALADEFRELEQTATRDGLLISTMPAMIYSTELGETQTITYVNNTVEKLVGFTADDFIGRTDFWFGRLHSEDQANTEDGQRALIEHNEHVHEYRFLHRDGRYRWLRDYRRLIRDRDGNPKEVIGCAIDITDLKLAEGRIASFLEGAPDPVITVNFNGEIVLANERAQRLFNYSKSEMIGQPVDMMIPKRRRKKVRRQREKYLKATDTQPLQPTQELLGMRRDGTEFPVEISMSRLDSGDEKLVAYAIRDLSGRKKVEAQLQQAQKMEAIGQLTGGVAHDFNNLLTVIVGNLQLIEDLVEHDDKVKKPIESALDAALRGASLTKRLLAFSRQQMLAPKVMDINKLVAGLQPLLNRTLGDNIEVKTKLDSEVWQTRIDSSQLENSIINLVINSRDAMPDGGTVVIETSNTVIDETYAANHTEVVPGEYVLLRVGDDGTGIPGSVLEHVFDPFFSTKERSKGSGLGLSMVYGFVKQSRGHIQIYSEEGYGTSVKIYLPRLSASGVDTSATTTGSGKVVPTGNETILLVEDEPAVREISSTLLRALGYRVFEAETGPEALAILDKHNDIDLVFTDVVMPGGLNGVELVRQALQNNPQLKTLYTSGYADTAVFDKALLSRGSDLLTKPYRKEELASKVREILDRD